MIVGDLHPAAGVPDLGGLHCTVTVDGETRGETLPAGALVFAGALTDAEPLVAGSDYRLTIESLGTIEVRA